MFRPIVSTIGSPTYDLAKELARILSPLAGSSETNTGEFIERLKKVNISSDDMMVSFDVVSLFTQVPLKEAMEIISTRLEQDETLEERTNIPVHDIRHLTEICLTSTYFHFQDAFYEQVDRGGNGITTIAHSGQHIHGIPGNESTGNLPCQAETLGVLC